MRLLVDMNLSPRWAVFLAAAGHPAAHWSSIGLATAADTELMHHAASAGLVILTHDLDFGAMLAAGGATGPSVIQLRAVDLSPEAVGPQVLAALTQAADALAAGALVTIDARRARITLLPIRV